MHGSFLRNLSALPRLTCYPNVGHRANDHLSRETVHRAASVAIQLVAELKAVHQKLSRGKQVELAIYKAIESVVKCQTYRKTSYGIQDVLENLYNTKISLLSIFL